MNLNQVTIPVTDVQRAIDFYEQLGLQLIVKALPHYARFECPQGEATFSLHLADVPLNNTGTWIYFEVPDVNQAVLDLANKGISISDQPEDKPWLWREARLADPDNNTIIIYHAGKNRKDPPWRIA